VQVNGVFLEPFNPLAVAIVLDAGFVARAFAGDGKQTREILEKAIRHKGYALVDILQPCTSFNKLNTYQWFNENAYYLEDSHDYRNRNEAFKKATEKEKIPLGIFYMNLGKKTFEENIGIYHENQQPLYVRRPDIVKLRNLIETFKIAD
jgi:2-oxoglutarate ferredoxin oxidoreductase subunit beta